MDVMLAAGVVPGKHIICRHIFLPLFGIGSANRPRLAHHPNAEEDLQMRIAVLGSGGIGGESRARLPEARARRAVFAPGAPLRAAPRRWRPLGTPGREAASPRPTAPVPATRVAL